MKEFLSNLLKSLDKIEVKGRDNMDIMLGCMMAIEQAIAQLDAPTEETNGEESEDG